MPIDIVTRVCYNVTNAVVNCGCMVNDLLRSIVMNSVVNVKLTRKEGGCIGILTKKLIYTN